jgi:hypothetical protein
MSKIVSTLSPGTGADRDEPHKAAIALNNAAVSLLARGLYQDAAVTLEDAVVLMGSAVVQAESPQATFASVTGQEIKGALDRVSLRTALYNDSAAAAHSRLDSPGMYRPKLQVISSQLNPTRVYETLTSCTDAASVKVSFPITIEPIEFERCTVDEMNFESGIILYNYGIAYDCLASACLEAATHRDDLALHSRLQNKAYHYYQCAGMVLHKIDQDVYENAPIAMTSPLLLLRTVMTHNLLNVAIQLNLQPEYAEFSYAMMILLHFVEAQHAFLPIEDHIVAVAA